MRLYGVCLAVCVVVFVCVPMCGVPDVLCDVCMVCVVRVCVCACGG